MKEFVNPFVEKRKKTFSLIQQILKSMESKGPVSYSQLTAIVQVNYGLSDKTARLYLKTLREAGFIIIDNGCVRSST